MFHQVLWVVEWDGGLGKGGGIAGEGGHVTFAVWVCELNPDDNKDFTMYSQLCAKLNSTEAY